MLPDAVLDEARSFADVTVHPQDTPLSLAEARAVMHEYDAVIPTLGDPYRAEAFEGGPFRAKVLANFGVGYNHIDADAARAAGLIVTNTPGAVTDATADIALTLMLMTCRRAGEGERMVRAGRWTGWQPTQMLGLHMTGKVLGIVGMGRIGKAIAKRALAGFGMEVVFYNRSPVADAGVPARQLGSLAEVMAAADLVVLAVPATPETYHLIDAEALGAMKSTAHLVNIARGDIVDEAALISALQSGQIAGAGLDVYEFEPRVPEALRAMEQVVLLPHLGTAALEVREAMGRMAVANARAILSGEAPLNPV
ncbi:MAG: D-glycerate dehydrogenase [Pseudomonadota bacterium]